MRRAWSGWVGFAASVVPLAAATAAISSAAARWVTPHVHPGWMLPLVLLAALCYVGVHIASPWPVAAAALLLVLGGLIGALLGRWIPASVQGAWGRAVLICAGLLTGAFVLALLAEGKLPLRPLWIGSWLYLLGWVVLSFLRPGSGAYRLWALLGAGVFTGLAAAWFGGVELGDPADTPRQATSMYLIGLNLAIALVLWFGLGA